MILANTEKGHGVSFMANVAAWHHAVPDPNSWRGRWNWRVNMQDLRDAVVTALIEQQRAGADLSVMVADSTSTSKIAPFGLRLIRSG